MPQAATPLIPFHVEHIVSRQHGGTDDPRGLALACDRCNAYKGPNLTSIDPDTGTVVALFSPRRNVWTDGAAQKRFGFDLPTIRTGELAPFPAHERRSHSGRVQGA